MYVLSSFFTVATAAESGQAAPWWGVPVIAGGFLVVGAVLGFLANWFLEGRRAKREATRKWDDRILDLTNDVIAKVDDFCSIAIAQGRKADGRAVLDEYDLLKESDGEKSIRQIYSYSEVGRAFLDLTDACAKLELIAPTQVRTVAASLRTFELLHAHPAAGYEAMAPIVEKVDEKRRLLESAVRKHFGIQ